MSNTNKKIAVGIDLGTTYSLIAVERRSGLRVITNEAGSRLTPSVVRVGKTTCMEKSVLDAILQYPKKTIHNVKRLMGRKFTDTAVDDFRKSVEFEIINKRGEPYIRLNIEQKTEYFTPEQISAMILKQLKSDAEKFLAFPVHDVVITVPAAFNEAQRMATKNAGMIAGFNVLAIINEPTAAALSWCYENEDMDFSDGVPIVVFDMGGGTTDISIVSICDGSMRVTSTTGDTTLGGNDIDALLVQHFVKQIKDTCKQDISKDPNSMTNLRKQCIDFKHQLSMKNIQHVKKFNDHILRGTTVELEMSRAEFENIIDPFRDKTMQLVKKALKLDLENCGNNKTIKINHVVLAGGSSRMPWIKAMFEKSIGEEVQIHLNANCDEVVAEGAALYASSLIGSSLCPKLKILDIAPLTYGVEVQGGQMVPIVSRGTPLPATHKRMFTTAVDMQKSVLVQIYEGSPGNVSECTKLQEFELQIKKQAEKLVPKIEITFNISQDFLLSATAKDLASGKVANVDVIQLGSRTSNELDEMRKRQEEFSNANAREEERIELRNQLEKLARTKGLNDVINWVKNNASATREEIEEKLKEHSKA